MDLLNLSFVVLRNMISAKPYTFWNQIGEKTEGKLWSTVETLLDVHELYFEK